MSPTQTINSAVSAEVRAELARQNIKQWQLATSLDWNPRMLSRRLSGETPWTVEEIAQVATVLRIPVLQLADPPRPSQITSE